MATLWKWQYEQEGSGFDLASATYVSRWVGDGRKTGWLGKIPGRTLGAYVRCTFPFDASWHAVLRMADVHID